MICNIMYLRGGSPLSLTNFAECSSRESLELLYFLEREEGVLSRTGTCQACSLLERGLEASPISHLLSSDHLISRLKSSGIGTCPADGDWMMKCRRGVTSSAGALQIAAAEIQRRGRVVRVFGNSGRVAVARQHEGWRTRTRTRSCLRETRFRWRSCLPRR